MVAAGNAVSIQIWMQISLMHWAHTLITVTICVGLVCCKQEGHDMLADGGLISSHDADRQAGGKPRLDR